MSEELTDKDPFGDDEVIADAELITEKMVKKATFLIHKLAELKGKEYKDIQKKCRSLFKYENLAKVSKDQGHAIINKLIELTGGEEEEQPTPEETKNPKTEIKKSEITTEETGAVLQMREAIRAAVSITLEEVVDKKVPVQGLGGFVLELAKAIFAAKMTEEG